MFAEYSEPITVGSIDVLHLARDFLDEIIYPYSLQYVAARFSLAVLFG